MGAHRGARAKEKDRGRRRSQSNQDPYRDPSRGAVHERHTGFSAVWLFGAGRGRAASFGREYLPLGQYLRRPRVARCAQAVFELAYLPAALRERRAGGRLRHRARPAPQRRAQEALDRGRGCSGLAATSENAALEGRRPSNWFGFGGWSRVPQSLRAQVGFAPRAVERVADRAKDVGG